MKVVESEYHFILVCPCFKDIRKKNSITVTGHLLVYVEWESRVNFVTIFGDLYQNKLMDIYNSLNQFTHLSSTSGPNNDVIKMATKVLLIHI